ncbi:PREDICTED: protein phosphatase 1 regulatory subunit 3E [Miniopterus natalensis]|uniref:protein phosphatase 1 regulatory subunit 3E n=1 Tax=Miniopterus natalensis TaxID=291302 RepID=UPI0007A6F747|nr:PREDICTED: protein phosphatase 1 regulatory subunit 3E [Miniopterus natalensis]
MSRERPPRTDIPRNLSFIAALTERAYYRSQRPSLEEEPEEEPGEGPDTRKRVRFADALGLELAVVRRFRPGELPRVPRHVQVQLQRDALRHFAPCQPRARGLQEARAALEPASEPGFAARLQAQRICLERFAFRLPAPPIGGALLFALRYRVTGHEFWDNNDGRDYALRGPEHPGSSGTPEPQGWIHFI